MKVKVWRLETISRFFLLPHLRNYKKERAIVLVWGFWGIVFYDEKAHE